MSRLVFFLLGIIPISVYGQSGLRIGFNDTHIGDNISLSYLIGSESVQVEFGIKYHIFNSHYDNQNCLLKDRVYPQTFLQHIGPLLGVRKRFLIDNSTIEPEIFLQSQYTYAGLHNVGYTPYGLTPDGRQIYTYDKVIFEAHNNLENIVGLGFSLEVFPWLHYYNRFGLVLGVFWDMDERISVAPSTTEWGTMFSIGCELRL